MNRRTFLCGLTLGALAGPLAAGAQPAQKVWHIGWLDFLGVADEFQAPFVRELRELGYMEGRNLVLEARHADWEFDRLPALAVDLVRLKVDLIVALSDPAIGAAMRSTRTIPIVMVGSTDPVGLGFIASLGRPGGNVTGLSNVGAELANKQLDLLKQTVPRLARVTVVTNGTVGAKERARERTRQTAQELGVSLLFEEVRNYKDVDQVFTTLKERRSDAMLVLGEGLFDRPTINRFGQLARKQKIPIMSGIAVLTYEGGLVSYAASYAPQAKRAAWYADKILKGSNPADLPIEQPTELRLVVNLETAKTLGLTIPQSVLLRADEVIR